MKQNKLSIVLSTISIAFCLLHFLIYINDIVLNLPVSLSTILFLLPVLGVVLSIYSYARSKKIYSLVIMIICLIFSIVIYLMYFILVFDLLEKIGG